MSKKIGFRSYQNDEEPDKRDELEKQQAECNKSCLTTAELNVHSKRLYISTYNISTLIYRALHNSKRCHLCLYNTISSPPVPAPAGRSD